MKQLVSSGFLRKYKKLTKKNPHLAQILDEKFALFDRNPKHQSLRLHKLSGKKTEQRSITIKGNLRVIFQYINEGILVVDIGSHDEVY